MVPLNEQEPDIPDIPAPGTNSLMNKHALPSPQGLPPMLKTYAMPDGIDVELNGALEIRKRGAWKTVIRRSGRKIVEGPAIDQLDIPRNVLGMPADMERLRHSLETILLYAHATPLVEDEKPRIDGARNFAAEFRPYMAVQNAYVATGDTPEIRRMLEELSQRVVAEIGALSA